MRRFALLLLSAAASLAGCAAETPDAVDDVEEEATGSSIQPVPRRAATTLSPEEQLGARLFADPRLSRDGRLACVTCHPLDGVGTDNVTRAAGAGARAGVVSTPTIYNVALNAAHFWDGRAATLEEQVDGPLLSPLEMGATWPDVLRRLADDATYARAFQDVYHRRPDERAVRAAIAAFERTLVLPDAPFDRWLRGDAGAIDAGALQGYRHFVAYGCASCHQGANVGGNLFQVLGVVAPRFTADRPATEYDVGIARRTGRDKDRHRFRVPSLRLAARTAPYMHDGSVATLDEAIALMGRLQLGVEIPAEERAQIAAFLATLAPKELR